MHISPVSYQNSFIAIEIYICMTSMTMLDITMEVSVNIGLPLKGRTQAWLGNSLGTLGHFWALLESFTFRHILEIGKLCSIGLWAKFTNSKK